MKAIKISALVFTALGSVTAAADLPEPLNTVVKAYQACADQVKSSNADADVATIKKACAAQEEGVKKVVPPAMQESFMRQMNDNIQSNVRM